MGPFAGLGADVDWCLRDFLSVPYRIEAQTLEVQPGVWVRRAAYPELRQCMCEAPTIEEALERLELCRIEIIVDILRAGRRPSVPRQPLGDCDPEGLMLRLGLHAQLAPLLDLAASQISNSSRS